MGGGREGGREEGMCIYLDTCASGGVPEFDCLVATSSQNTRSLGVKGHLFGRERRVKVNDTG